MSAVPDALRSRQASKDTPLDTPFPCTGTDKLAVHVYVAVNKGRLPLTREKLVGYRVEWLLHYYIWKIVVAFYKTTR